MDLDPAASSYLGSLKFLKELITLLSEDICCRGRLAPCELPSDEESEPLSSEVFNLGVADPYCASNTRRSSTAAGHISSYVS